MNDIDVNADMDELVSADLVKAAQEADLIDTGRYRFQVETAEKVENMKEFFDEAQTQKNPWYGKSVYNLRLSLSAIRNGKGKDAPYVSLDRPRTYFQKVSPAQVLNRAGELSTESKLFGQIAGIVMKTSGQASVRQTLDYFKDRAGEITITKSEESEKDGKHYDAKNWTRGIKALSVEA